MTKQYGFYIEEYETGEKVGTLLTGDGKTLFSPLDFKNGTIGIGFSYGLGGGIGHIHEEFTGMLSTEIAVKFQIIFEQVGTIDSLISTLEEVKKELIKAQSLPSGAHEQ